ncbi:uncharacterized protein LOC120344948 [Styela clava]
MNIVINFGLVFAVFGVALGQDDYTFVCGPMEDTEIGEIGCRVAEGKELKGVKGDKGDRGLLGQKGTKGSRGPFGNFGPQGPMGRMGVPGKQGPPGPPGEMGKPGDGDKVDKSEFDDYKRYMEEKLQILQDNLDSLKSCCVDKDQIEPTTETTTATTTNPTTPKPSDNCFMIYGDKCFSINGRKNNLRTVAEYVSACESEGGAAANLYSTEHYTLMMVALREKLNRNIYAMLGMKYNVQERKLLFSNETDATFDVVWRPENPTFHPSHTYVQIYMNQNVSSPQGLYNRASNHNRDYGICEFAVKAKDDVPSSPWDITDP